MPRSNRPRRPHKAPEEFPPLTADILNRGRSTELRSGRSWIVQNVAAGTSAKEYTCPGCHLIIQPGAAHVVAWREDGVLGDEDDLRNRRHWHRQCWRIAR